MSQAELFVGIISINNALSKNLLELLLMYSDESAFAVMP